MTEDQKTFLRMHVVEQKSYDTICRELNISRVTLSQWYEELTEERTEIAKIRTIWTRKRFTPEFVDFYNWYISKDRKCKYCGITESEIGYLLENRELSTKRITTRGRTLEFDRKDPNLAYSELNNIVLACYWCNNAKTDTFTYEEFKIVGEVFSRIWKERYRKTLDKVSPLSPFT